MNIAILNLDEILECDKIDESVLMQQQYGDRILYLAKQIMQRIPKEKLKLFFNNMNGVTIEETKTFRLLNILQGVKTQAKYVVTDNFIKVDKNPNDMLLLHELLHLASSFCKDNVVFSGFSQGFLNSGYVIGNAVTEGYTQLLTERFLNNYQSAYELEKRIVQMLEKIIGNEVMESMYFSADLNGLINQLMQYRSYNDTIKFIKDFDEISDSLEKMKNQKISQKDVTIFKEKIRCRRLTTSQIK